MPNKLKFWLYKVLFASATILLNENRSISLSTDRPESKTKECANFKFEVKSSVK